MENLSDDIRSALPFFHAYTGCDTVSSFYGIGKTRAWNVWMKMPDITQVFNNLSNSMEIQDEDFQMIEWFTVLMYDTTSTTRSVNECRRILFTKRNRSIENIPPTADALKLHVKRAILQTMIWKQCLQREMEIPPFTSFGWKRSSSCGYEPLWTTIPEVTKACSELMCCHCKTMCVRNCRCESNNRLCTSLLIAMDNALNKRIYLEEFDLLFEMFLQPAVNNNLVCKVIS